MSDTAYTFMYSIPSLALASLCSSFTEVEIYKDPVGKEERKCGKVYAVQADTKTALFPCSGFTIRTSKGDEDSSCGRFACRYANKSGQLSKKSHVAKIASRFITRIPFSDTTLLREFWYCGANLLSFCGFHFQTVSCRVPFTWAF